MVFNQNFLTNWFFYHKPRVGGRVRGKVRCMVKGRVNRQGPKMYTVYIAISDASARSPGHA